MQHLSIVPLCARASPSLEDSTRPALGFNENCVILHPSCGGTAGKIEFLGNIPLCSEGGGGETDGRTDGLTDYNYNE